MAPEQSAAVAPFTALATADVIPRVQDKQVVAAAGTVVPVAKTVDE